MAAVNIDSSVLRDLSELCASRNGSRSVAFLREDFGEEQKDAMVIYLQLIRMNDPFAKDFYESALGQGARHGNTKLFEYLSQIGVLRECVKSNVAVDKTDRKHISLVQHAAFFSPDILRLLLRYENAFSRSDQRNVLESVCLKGKLESLRVLLDDPRVDLSHLDFGNTSALHHTAVDGPKYQFLLFCLLLCKTHKHYRVINHQDSRGRTPLHLVTRYHDRRRSPHRLLLLLAFGADTTILDGKDRSYLLDECHGRCLCRHIIGEFSSPDIRRLVKHIVLDLNSATWDVVRDRNRIIDENRRLRANQTDTDEENEKLRAEKKQLRRILAERERVQQEPNADTREAFALWFDANFEGTKYAKEFERFRKERNDDLVFWVESLLGAPQSKTAEKAFEQIVAIENPREIETFFKIFKERLNNISLSVFFPLKGIDGESASVLEEQGYNTLGGLLSSDDVMGIPIYDELLVAIGIEGSGDRNKILRILECLGCRSDGRDGDVEEEGDDYPFREVMRIPNSTLGVRMA